MADGEFTLIYYYVPEDLDDMDIFNAFGIRKAIPDLRLADIQSQFPLPGQYQFRFKYKQGTEYVWLDLVNPNCKIPAVDGKVIVKATRKSWGPGVGTCQTFYIALRETVFCSRTRPLRLILRLILRLCLCHCLSFCGRD